MKSLTPKQEKILSFIEKHRKKHTESPTYQEIQSFFGFASPNAVLDHVRALVKKGYVKLRHGSRGIIPLRPQKHQVPLVGAIAAGSPIEAIENIETTLDLSTIGVDNADQEFFALRVKGNSMINAHILHRDIVVIRKQESVNANDVAAVLWNGEATLKYLRRSGKGYLLIPANDAMEPMAVLPERTSELQILGKVVRVIRGA